jgi:cyclic pyranopterin monophosphate synthase
VRRGRFDKRRQGDASRLTHVDALGRARMVDVGAKSPTPREAVAEGSIRMSRAAFRAIRTGRIAKGDAVTLGRVAGIAAAKRTSELIPLCHTVPLDHVRVDVRFGADGRTVTVEAGARARWSTGVEMEALVAVAVSLLTLYDMAKAIDRGMTLGAIRLVRKSGGRSGEYVRRRPAIRASTSGRS